VAASKSKPTGVSMSRMVEQEVRRRPGGRSARVRASVLEAALELLLAHHLEGFRVSEVADRAGVHETSIYRRWGTRENLLIDALLDATEGLRVPDTGSLRDDLTAYAQDLADFLATPVGHALERTLAVAGDDPDTRAARDRYWASRSERSQQMVVRAVERGELPDTVDPRLLIEMLVSPVHFRVLLTREPVDPAMPARLVDALLDGAVGAR
jgi:AcrR family transcriptional regulator